MNITCAGPHLGQPPVLGSTDATDRLPDHHGMLCEDCGQVYLLAQSFTGPLADLAVAPGQIPPADTVAAVLPACRPAGYTPPSPPTAGPWPPAVPAKYAAALGRLPRIPPRHGVSVTGHSDAQGRLGP